MIDTILDPLFTDGAIAIMGDWYPVVYSWSYFALIVSFCLCSLICFVGLIRVLLRCFR